MGRQKGKSKPARATQKPELEPQAFLACAHGINLEKCRLHGPIPEHPECYERVEACAERLRANAALWPLLRRISILGGPRMLKFSSATRKRIFVGWRSSPLRPLALRSRSSSRHGARSALAGRAPTSGKRAAKVTRNFVALLASMSLGQEGLGLAASGVEFT
eukprot:s3718_g4.t1